MAEYYTNFSAVLSLPSQEALDYALNLHRKMLEAYEDDEDDDKKSFLDIDIECGVFECEPHTDDGVFGFCIYDGDGEGSIDCVLSFVKHLLVKYSLKPWGLEWSYDCTKPRLDAFGGGAAIVTADGIQDFSTSQWIEDALAAEAAKHAGSPPGNHPALSLKFGQM
jgi:hypothetical protein